MTYVNHIRAPHDQVNQLVACWPHDDRAFLPPVEDVRFSARYLIKDAQGNMIGRLIAELQPAYITSTRAEIISLNMIARGRPASPDIDGAIGFLQLGHEWIVRGFAELTTPAMHEMWKRTQ